MIESASIVNRQSSIDNINRNSTISIDNPQSQSSIANREIGNHQSAISNALGSFDADLLQRFIRTSLPLGHEDVAHVLEILDSHPAGPEPAGGEIAEGVEEGDAVGHCRRGLGGPRDIVEQLRPLSLGARDEHLVVTIGGFA